MTPTPAMIEPAIQIVVSVRACPTVLGYNRRRTNKYGKVLMHQTCTGAGLPPLGKSNLLRTTF